MLEAILFLQGVLVGFILACVWLMYSNVLENHRAKPRRKK